MEAVVHAKALANNLSVNPQEQQLCNALAFTDKQRTFYNFTNETQKIIFNSSDA